MIDRNFSENTSLKIRIKRAMQRTPIIWTTYWETKQQIIRALNLRYFSYDILNTYARMYWSESKNKKYFSLSSELLFQYHKIEKGLVMPPPKRYFGGDVAARVVELMKRWTSTGLSKTDPVFLGALETLRGYHSHLTELGQSVPHGIREKIKAFIDEFPAQAYEFTTPVALSSTYTGTFGELAALRRSVRSFSNETPDASELIDAVRIAQLSPSVCNRQSWRTRFFQSPPLVSKLLSFQNGNRGFGHQIPIVAIITSDERSFVNASERHQPYIDGGMFAMSFILALADKGIGSCCLNWCVTPKIDRLVHKTFDIPAEQRIIMLVAIGKPIEGCMVPRSPRRDTSSIVDFY